MTDKHVVFGENHPDTTPSDSPVHDDPHDHQREAPARRTNLGDSEQSIGSFADTDQELESGRTPPAAAEGSGQPPDPGTQATRNTIAALERERDDYYDRWLRKSAEFDNYRKRIERERREQTDQSILELLRELLLVIDDFDLALAVEAGEGGAPFKKGVEMIHAKVHDLLKRYGVRPIGAVGAAFDPNVHQAVSHEASPGHRDGEVIDELRRGYMIKDRLLRPSMVKVAKA